MEPQKKAQIPSLKDTKKPVLKIKGLAGGTSLVERIKSFRKKDLAFIAAGLMVLFMAPLVEHFLMAPETGQGGAFKEGWSFRDSGSFGKGGSPYEPGLSGMAPGGLLGAGSEIITPLNVRDPSALVMGPGQSSQKPVTAPAPTESASAAKPASDWKDALAAAAGRGAKAAAQKSPVAVPKVPLQGSLRGLGVLGGGGSGASYGLPPISAANVPNKAKESRSLGSSKAATGYQGTAGTRGKGASGSLENAKKAAADAAGAFHQGGGAASNLVTAADASQAIPGGSGAAGASGHGKGDDDKGGSQNQDRGGRSQSNDSLDFLIKKENAMRQLDLDWQKKTKKEMFPLEMQQEVQKTLLMKGLVEPIAGGVGKIIGSIFDGIIDRSKDNPGQWVCTTPLGTFPGTIPACSKCGQGDKASGECFEGGKVYVCSRYNNGGAEKASGCVKQGGDKADDADKKDPVAPQTPKSPNESVIVDGTTYDAFGLCKKIGASLKSAKAASAQAPADEGLKKLVEALEKLHPSSAGLVAARDALWGMPSEGAADCAPERMVTNPGAHGERNIIEFQRSISKKLMKHDTYDQGDIQALGKYAGAADKYYTLGSGAKTKTEKYSTDIKKQLCAEATCSGTEAVKLAVGKGKDDPDELMKGAAKPLTDADGEYAAGDGFVKEAETLHTDVATILSNVGGALTSAGGVIGQAPDTTVMTAGSDLEKYWNGAKSQHATINGVYAKLKNEGTGVHNRLNEEIGNAELVGKNVTIVGLNLNHMMGAAPEEGASVQPLPNGQVLDKSASPATQLPEAPMPLKNYYEEVNGDGAENANLNAAVAGGTVKKAGAVAKVSVPDTVPAAPGTVVEAVKPKTDHDIAKAAMELANETFEGHSGNVVPTFEHITQQCKNADESNGVIPQIEAVKTKVKETRVILEDTAAGKKAETGA